MKRSLAPANEEYNQRLHLTKASPFVLLMIARQTILNFSLRKVISYISSNSKQPWSSRDILNHLHFTGPNKYKILAES